MSTSEINTTSTFINILLDVSGSLFDFGFIFFPSIGFIHQYIKIKRLKSSYGFSKLISLILFIAFIFRIFFWIGKRFEIIILLQSIVGVVMQLFLIQACVQYTSDFKNKNDSNLFDIREFWDWPYFFDYFNFVLLLSVFLGSISNLFGYDNNLYIELLGSVSALSEAMLGLPQIWENYKIKNVNTLSYLMIVCWILGDCAKTFYYIKSSSPIQLILCGLGQILGDKIIICQIYYYTRIKYNKLDNNHDDRVIIQ